MYIVNNLKVKILLGINILSPEYILIDVDKRKLLIRNYNNLITKIKIKVKNNIKVRRYIHN